MTAVPQAESVKARDPNIGAVLLHPYIRGHFATDLLIDRAGISVLSKFMRHGTPED